MKTMNSGMNHHQMSVKFYDQQTSGYLTNFFFVFMNKISHWKHPKDLLSSAMCHFSIVIFFFQNKIAYFNGKSFFRKSVWHLIDQKNRLK